MAYETKKKKKKKRHFQWQREEPTDALQEKEVLVSHLPSLEQKDQEGEIHLEKPVSCQSSLKKANSLFPTTTASEELCNRLTSSLLLLFADEGCVMEKSGDQTTHPCSGPSELKYRKRRWQALSLHME